MGACKRFKGKKVTTWTRTRTNQVGPDADIGTDPSGNAYNVYHEKKFIAYTPVVFDGYGLNGTAGEYEFTAKLDIDVTEDFLIDKKLRAFFTNSYYTITGNTAGLAGEIITINTLEPLSTTYVTKTATIATGDYKFNFVSKAGLDTDAGTVPAVPKLTIQASINAAVADSSTDIVILDNGTYQEKVNLSGINIQTYKGYSPTIQFPALGFSGAATGLTSPSVTAFAEFTYNGAPCLYASTGDGLWRTLDGMAWTQVALDNKDLRGCCVWNEKLYVTNYTDSQVNAYTDDFTASTISAATMGVTGGDITGGAFNLGPVLYIAISDGAVDCSMFNGSTWVASVNSTLYRGKTIYDAILSTKYALAISNETLVSFDVTDRTQSATASATFTTGSIVPKESLKIGNNIYVLTSTSLYRLSSIFDIDTINKISDHGVTTATGMATDDRGWIYVFGASSYAISRDNGTSWYTYGTAPASKSTYAPSAFFRGVGMVAKATGIAYDDQVHVRGAGSINGCYVNGTGVLSQALEFVRLEASQAFTYNDVYGHYEMTHDYANSVFDISSSRIHDMSNGATGIDHFGKNNHIYNITGIVKVSTTQTATEDDLTIERNGYGLICANSYGAEDSIIYGNSVDFVESSAAISPAFTDSVLGSIITTQDATMTNCSRSNPLLLTDGDVKDKSGGYAYDSVAIGLGAGCYKITRTSSEAYAIDHHLSRVPTGELLTWNVSNYQSNENADGEYGETFDGLKRRIELSWSADQYAENQQLYKLVDIYSQEDTVFQYGNSDGTNWIPFAAGACSVNGSAVTITALSANVGKNEYAGYWVLIGSTYYRIVSHPQANAGASCALTVSGTPTGTTYSIDYLLVKIDKSQTLQATQYLTSSRVVSGYNLVLREVDNE